MGKFPIHQRIAEDTAHHERMKGKVSPATHQFVLDLLALRDRAMKLTLYATGQKLTKAVEIRRRPADRYNTHGR